MQGDTADAFVLDFGTLEGEFVLDLETLASEFGLEQTFMRRESLDFGLLSFDYVFDFNIGFNLDFNISAGQVQIVSPIDLDVRTFEDATSEGIIVDTSNFSFGEQSVVALSPNFSISAGLFADVLLYTFSEEVGFDGLSRPINLPDFNESFEQSLFSVDSQSSVPLFDADFAPFNISANIPATFGAISGDPDDFGQNGSVTAFGTSTPFLSLDVDLVDLAASFVPAFSTFNTITAAAELVDDETGATNNLVDVLVNVLDLNLNVDLLLAQEHTFTPGDIVATVTNLTTGEIQTGQLGDEFLFQPALNGADSEFTVAYTLTGTVVSQYGFVPDFSLDFEAIEFDIDVSGVGDFEFGPLFSDQVDLGSAGIDPVFVFTVENEISFTTQTLSFTHSSQVAATLPTVVAFSDTSTTEGGQLVFEVVLDQAPTEDIRIPFEITGGTLAGQVIGSDQAEIIILAGETRGTLSIDTFPDSDTNDETIEITLLRGDGYVLGADASAIGTIIDDDVAQTPTLPSILAISDITVAEGETVQFDVALSEPTTSPVDVSYTVVFVSADNQDIGEIQGTVSIPAGAFFATVEIDTIDDSIVELSLIHI